MRVLFITDPGIVGGATRSLVELTATLQSSGVEVIVCTSGRNELNKELSGNLVKNFACGHRSVMDVQPKQLWKKPIKFVIDFAKYYISVPYAIKQIENNIDLKTINLIHTNSARNDIGAVLSSKYHIPHIAHIREFGKEDFNCWTYRLNYYSFMNQHTDRFVAISEAVKKSWANKGLNTEKITVVYNGVDVEKILPTTPESLMASVCLKMVIVGGICIPKGQYQAIEAMAKLPENIKKCVTLDIIGWSEEDYLIELKIRVSKLNLSGQVHFLGVYNDIYQRLQDYHIGLMCSKSEGFGRVTVEYMAAGLGVIASDAGANPELIHSGKNGLLYELDNIDSLAERIIRYYNDRKLLCHCSENGRKCARTLYTKEINEKNIEALYQKVLMG